MLKHLTFALGVTTCLSGITSTKANPNPLCEELKEQATSSGGARHPKKGDYFRQVNEKLERYRQSLNSGDVVAYTSPQTVYQSAPVDIQPQAPIAQAPIATTPYVFLGKGAYFRAVQQRIEEYRRSLNQVSPVIVQTAQPIEIIAAPVSASATVAEVVHIEPKAAATLTMTSPSVVEAANQNALIATVVTEVASSEDNKTPSRLVIETPVIENAFDVTEVKAEPVIFEVDDSTSEVTAIDALLGISEIATTTVAPEEQAESVDTEANEPTTEVFIVDSLLDNYSVVTLPVAAKELIELVDTETKEQTTEVSVVDTLLGNSLEVTASVATEEQPESAVTESNDSTTEVSIVDTLLSNSLLETASTVTEEQPESVANGTETTANDAISSTETRHDSPVIDAAVEPEIELVASNDNKSSATPLGTTIEDLSAEKLTRVREEVLALQTRLAPKLNKHVLGKEYDSLRQKDHIVDIKTSLWKVNDLLTNNGVQSELPCGGIHNIIHENNIEDHVDNLGAKLSNDLNLSMFTNVEALETLRDNLSYLNNKIDSDEINARSGTYAQRKADVADKFAKISTLLQNADLNKFSDFEANGIEYRSKFHQLKLAFMKINTLWQNPEIGAVVLNMNALFDPIIDKINTAKRYFDNPYREESVFERFEILEENLALIHDLAPSFLSESATTPLETEISSVETEALNNATVMSVPAVTAENPVEDKATTKASKTPEEELQELKSLLTSIDPLLDGALNKMKTSAETSKAENAIGHTAKFVITKLSELTPPQFELKGNSPFDNLTYLKAVVPTIQAFNNPTEEVKTKIYVISILLRNLETKLGDYLASSSENKISE